MLLCSRKRSSLSHRQEDNYGDDAESGDPLEISGTIIGNRDDAEFGDPSANAEITVSHFYSRPRPTPRTTRTRRRPSRYAL